MRNCGVFNKMKNKNFIGGFIATVFISVITTSSYAYVDYTCNCGYDQINDGANWLYNNTPMCSGSKTVNCIVSKNNSGFVYRASGTYYEPACSFCFCSTHISEWENTPTAGVLRRATTVPYDYNDYTCNSNVTNEWACSSGYYGLFYEPDFKSYECLECPWLYDDNGGGAHGLTEYANKNATITDCYIQESDLRGMYFKDEPGDYVLEGGDCYYSK